MKVEERKVAELIPYANNARTHSDEQITKLCSSIREFGFTTPIIIDEENNVLAGHGRLEAVKRLGWEKVPCAILEGLTKAQKKAYILADNKLALDADWDFDMLRLELENLKELDYDLDFTGFDDDFLNELEVKERYDNPQNKNPLSLQERFIVPPLSVFDTKQGYWQNRKKEWLDLGIKSELGRKDDLIFAKDISKYSNVSQTSIFDPVLCEVCYKWFNVKNGKILDPFAGGSVRGIVASVLGFEYTGIDLRKEQIEANEANAKEMKLEKMPKWICDDSLNIDEYIDDNTIDMIFSCPPYGDLEKYSDDERDLSNMNYEKFVEIYSKIIQKSLKKLKQNRFAIFIVGDIRDKKGFYRDFIGDTKKAFIDNNALLYNEIILLNALGTASIRANSNENFTKFRKVCKIHQNVLVFYKGDPKKIKDDFDEIEMVDLDE